MVNDEEKKKKAITFFVHAMSFSFMQSCTWNTSRTQNSVDIEKRNNNNKKTTIRKMI